MKGLFMFSVCAFFGVCAWHAQGDELDKNELLAPKEKVTALVHNITGLDNYFSIDDVRRVPLPMFAVPFSPADKERMGIRVRFKPGRFRWRTQNQREGDPYVRQFDVYIDNEAQTVLAVCGSSPDGDYKRPKEIDVLDFHAIDKSGAVKSFASKPGLLTFADVMLSFPTTIRPEIEGILVSLGRSSQDRPVWILRLRGGPSEPFVSDDEIVNEKPLPRIFPKRKPLESFYRYWGRYTDAETGAYLFGYSSGEPR